MTELSRIVEFTARSGGVVVLCGGPGGEREVSLDSGRSVHEALTRAGLDCRLVVVPEERPEAFLSSLECALAVMMLHGEFGEDGAAQAILEERGIPYTGSDAAACRLAMDKNATKRKMLERGIPTPRWAVAANAREAALAVREAELRYPLFVKPNAGGSSVGTSRVDVPEELANAVSLTLSVGKEALLEEMVVGRELTVGWLGGRLLPIIELDADGVFYDYRAKYKSDKTSYRCPAEVEPHIALAVNKYSALLIDAVGARDLARVDLMLGKEGPMVLELNALPGFTSHSLVPMAAAAAGISLEEVCLSLADMAASRSGGDWQ